MKPNNTFQRNLFSVIKRGHMKSVLSCLQSLQTAHYEVDLNYTFYLPPYLTPLGQAAFKAASLKGHTPITYLLLEKYKVQIDCVNVNVCTALHYAAWNGHLECVKLLITHGANIRLQNKWGETPLDCAISMKHEEICTFLMPFYDL